MTYLPRDIIDNDGASLAEALTRSVGNDGVTPYGILRSEAHGIQQRWQKEASL